MILENVSLEVLLQKCTMLLTKWWLQAQEGGHETALKMMQYLGWKKSASCCSISSWWRDSTRTGLSFPYPAHFNLYSDAAELPSEVIKPQGLLPAPQPCLPQSCSVFDFLLSALQNRKGSNSLTLCPWKCCTLGSLNPTHLSQGENRPMHLQKAESYSF